MSKLITGGTGYIGSELAYLLVEQGNKVVLFDVEVNHERIADIENEVKVVQGDLGVWPEVFNVVKDNNIRDIYHLGSMLTYKSELNPWGSFRANVVGTYNVLEAARLCGVEKVMFSSTLGTFSMEVDETMTDVSLQRPTSMYGCGKLYCEGLGRVYRRKFGLDFRSIRYSPVIGPNIVTPGHWAPVMIQDAILGKPHVSIYGSPEAADCMIHVRDAARAAAMVLEAPEENIKMVNYNVAGVSNFITAKELEALLKSRYPKTKVTFDPDPVVRSVVYKTQRKARVLDDTPAREEWDWKPLYESPEAIIDKFEKTLKEDSQRYELGGDK